MARSRNIGTEILQGLREFKRGDHGRVTAVPSISGIRERTGLSQSQFAQLLGVSVRTLQDWGAGPTRAVRRGTYTATCCSKAS